MIIQKSVFVGLVSLVATGTGLAEELVCKNPGREYLLSYDPGAGVVTVNPDRDETARPVLSTLVDDGQYVVITDLG